MVVMDDFIYAEPQAIQAVPMPASLTLMGSGLIGLLVYAWRRR